jgi:4-hydroxybenzoate polyprenyltransferase
MSNFILIKRIKIYFELTRPFTLLSPLIGFLSGAIIAARTFPPLLSYIGAISAVSLNAASNTMNQCFDLDIDRINKPHRPLPSGRIKKENALIFGWTLYALSLILASSVNFQFFFLALATLLITFSYSAPPLRLKKRGIIANVSIAIPRGLLLIVAGWASVKTIFNPEPWFIGTIFGLYILGAATTKDFADIEGDKRYGVKTLPIIYGIKRSAWLISPFFIFPFLLIFVGINFKIIKANTWPLSFLSLWGIYVAYLILRKPEELTIEANHISWKHMYLILISGQIGFAITYLL